MTIQGLPVLLIQPNFATAPKITGSYITDDADISEARRVAGNVWDHPIHSFGFEYLFTSRAAAALLEDFFDSVCGKWLQFWTPSWQAELNPTATLSSGGTSLKITSVDYPNVFDPTNPNLAALGHYIYLVSINGDIFISQVIAASTSAGVDTLTLATAAPQDFTLGQFIVGFMYCVNSQSDTLTLNYDGMSSISTNIAVTEGMEIVIVPPTLFSVSPSTLNSLVTSAVLTGVQFDPSAAIQLQYTSTGGGGGIGRTATVTFVNSTTLNISWTTIGASGGTLDINYSDANGATTSLLNLPYI